MLRKVIGARLVVAFVILTSHRVVLGGECPNVDYGGSLTIGGPSSENAIAIATDSAGNRFITGLFIDTVDFDPTDGIDLHSATGSCDPYVTKLNADGSYGWTRTFRGPSCDLARGVAVDHDNNVVVTGYFWETVDFDPSEGVDEHSTNGDRDAFVTKLFADGSYAWTRTFGGESTEEAWDVVVDQEGNVFATGSFNGLVDFDPTDEGEDEHLSAGLRDVFVTKFTGDGDFVWTKTFGGPESDYVRRIASGPGGSLFVTGSFWGTSDFDPSEDAVSEHTSNGGNDIYILKLEVDGSYVWSRTMGGSAFDRSNEVAVDGDGGVILSGVFSSDDAIDFDPTDGVDERVGHGYYDIFATKLTADGDYGWTWTAGGIEYEHIEGLAIDMHGIVYFSGKFGNSGTPPGYVLDFDATGDGDEHISNGGGDGFITQLAADGSYGWTRTFGGPGVEEPRSLTRDLLGSIHVAGLFTETSDLDPTEGVDFHESNGLNDIFVTTLLCTDELPCDGDANGDGLVDPLDSGFVLARFGCDVGSGDPDCDVADMNGDALVDPLDVGYVLARFGTCG